MGNIDGFAKALEALQALDAKDQQRILQDISAKNPEMAQKLRDSLFSFADLQYLLAADFKILWWEVQRSTWHLALRKAPSGVLKMLEAHLTKRAYLELTSQLQSQSPQPLSKVLAAQKEICDVSRALISDGKMAAPSPKKNDPMV